MHIGEYVIIEQNSIICASKIGNYVHIGKNCIVVSFMFKFVFLKKKLSRDSSLFLVA